MLRFNPQYFGTILSILLFQYILCYGSTLAGIVGNYLDPLFQYILCYGSTELMPRLQSAATKFQYILCYGSTVRVGTRLSNDLKFQYILCYGSTIKITNLSCTLNYFNTSYVTVQPGNPFSLPTAITISIHPMLRFNADTEFKNKQSTKISIHPMLRFNYDFLNGREVRYLFQYILCYGSTLNTKMKMLL